MPDNNKTKEFLQKLAPCIERGELEKCVEEAARVAGEMGVIAPELLILSWQMGEIGIHNFAYILALVAAQDLKGEDKANAYSNAGLAAQYLGKLDKSEECYRKAIEFEPNLAIVHYNYAVLLYEYKRKEEAEKHFLKAIEADPKDAKAHSNYAILLTETGNKEEAEKHYLKAIEADPKDAVVHSNYANLLHGLNRKEEAENQYQQAIDANPKLAVAHGGYGFLLVNLDRSEKAQDEIEKASNLFKGSGRITDSHLAWAWFHEQYSEKYFKMRKFPESGKEAGKAGDEYLKAAGTVDDTLKYQLSQHGNILKAKSHVRKVPKKYWYTNIIYKFGRKCDISSIIDNLKHAASYYEKAALCPIEERQDVCSACHISISVFSDTLSVMEAIIDKRSPEINKKEWITKLDGAHRIYKEKGMKNGVALVDTLKQLIQCIDEMAVFREGGLGIQKEKCSRCFGELTKVSEKLDGALNVLAGHSIEAIRDYAKKQGMGGFIEDDPKKSIWNNWILRAAIVVFGTIFLNLVSSKLYDLNILAIIWNSIKSLLSKI